MSDGMNDLTLPALLRLARNDALEEAAAIARRYVFGGAIEESILAIRTQDAPTAASPLGTDEGAA